MIARAHPRPLAAPRDPLPGDLAVKQSREDRLDILDAAFEHGHHAIEVLDRDARFLDVNPAWERLTGYTRQEALGRTPAELLRSDKHSKEFYDRTWQTLLDGEVLEVRIISRFKDGSLRTQDLAVRPVMDEAGQLLKAVAIRRDVSEQVQNEEQLLWNAQHDPLTALANRSLFLERVQHVLARHRRSEEPRFALLFLDLDRFKLINDSLGHEAGDKLLCDLARRLEKSVRPGDTVARLGGDEFAMLLEDLNVAGDAYTIARRVLAVFEEPFTLAEQPIYTGGSVGITLGEPGYHNASDVLRDADAAMYQAKATGGGRFEVFDATLRFQARQKLLIQSSLPPSLAEDRFLLHYQPVVQCGTGRVVGSEGLLRWDRPGVGLVSPGGFIAVAEETGFIVPLGRWAMREACRQQAEWRRSGAVSEASWVAVNLSPRQFAHPGLYDDVVDALRDHELPAEALRLELTESAVMAEPDLAVRLLSRLRDLGVAVALDDFGTGYSSLAHLHRFPLSELKIDRRFVSQLGTVVDAEAIVRAMVGVGHALGQRVIGEGVETVEQLELLTTLECDAVQGYLMGPGRPAEEHVAWLARHRDPGHWSPETAPTNPGAPGWTDDDEPVPRLTPAHVSDEGEELAS